MKIAIISDVHGNYPALANVIEDARKNNADRFIFIGDYIFDLPFSNEVTSLLMSLENADVIKGNKEAYLRQLSNENQRDWIYKQKGGIYQTFRELSTDNLEYLMSLKEDSYIPIGNGVIYAAHYFKSIKQPSKQNCGSSGFHKKMLVEPFTHEQYLDEFGEMLMQDDFRNEINSIDASVILFGHNHLQGYGYCDGKLIINPGSCGQPLDFNADAAYTILETSTSGINIIEKRVKYDIEDVIRKAKESKLYENGQIWSEMVFLALRTGRDYFGILFEIANRLAESKGEKGQYFSNETWEEAYATLLSEAAGALGHSGTYV